MKLVLASHNPGKLQELRALLGPLGFETVPQGRFGVDEAEEPHETFLENALAKARHASRITGLAALADDSGLVVPALDGAPGIYSARWAGPGKDFRVAMERVQRELADKDRRAQFVAVLVLAWPDGEVALFRGEVEGQLTWPPRGERGFGYDPIFVPNGYDRTFAEIDAAKHQISHRARAFAKLVEACL